MATGKSTTPTRRDRRPFVLQLPENASDPIPAPALFVQAGETFERASNELVLQHARRVLARRFHPGIPILNSPERVSDFLRFQIGPLDYEVFAVILLDGHRRLIRYVELFRGTFDHVKVYPRQVAECALRHGANAVVLVHNHPRGTASPSSAAVCLTTTLKRTLALIDVEVLDHLIVAETVVSLAKLGLVK